MRATPRDRFAGSGLQSPPALTAYDRCSRLPRWLSIIPIIAIAACSAPPSTGVTTSSATPSAAASTSSSSAASGYRVLVVTTALNGSQVLLFDSASSAPQQLASVPAGAPPAVTFVSTGKIAYSQSTSPSSSQIVTVDLSTHATTTEVTAAGLIPAFDYSHDGTMLAYLLHDQSGKASLHVRRNGQEFTLNLNPIPGRGVGRDDELRLEYAPDDQYLLMVDTFVGNQAQAPETGQFLVLRTSDNTVAFVPPSGTSSNATMASWAAHRDRLYYRDQVGVRVWDAGTTSVGTLATALDWYDPAVSPDDRSIAYTIFDTQSVPHVQLLDLQSTQSTPTATSPRSHPVFLTTSLLWYLEEQPCQSECLGGPSQSSGKVFAYNLRSRSESSLPFTDVHTLSELAVGGR